MLSLLSLGIRIVLLLLPLLVVVILVVTLLLLAAFRLWPRDVPIHRHSNTLPRHRCFLRWPAHRIYGHHTIHFAQTLTRSPSPRRPAVRPWFHPLAPAILTYRSR